MANEKRLIAYDAVYQYAFDGVHGGGLEDEDFNAIINAIDSVPTIDAVEVVRCKDCKHYQQYHKGRTEELCEWGKCKLISMDIDMPCNGFCCFGERRNNESEEPV